MPCFGCGARQTDPVRGPSDWRRGVRADRQVLVCPGCQATVELDRCESCSSAALVCRLGEIECRSCGHVREAVRTAEPAPTGAPGLSGEVAAALNRLRGRPLL